MKPNYGDPYKRRSEMTQLLHKSPMSRHRLADMYQVPYSIIVNDMNSLAHKKVFEISGYEEFNGKKVVAYKSNLVLDIEEVKPKGLQVKKEDKLSLLPDNIKILMGYTDFVPPINGRIFDANDRHVDMPKRQHKVYIGSNWDAYGLLNIGF